MKEPGYYWFQGTVKGMKYQGLMHVFTTSDKEYVSILGWGGWYEMEILEGQWWGPLTPPWENEGGYCGGNCTCNKDTDAEVDV